MQWRSASVLVVLTACSFVDSVDDYAGEPSIDGGTEAGNVDASDGPWPGCGPDKKPCGTECVDVDDPAFGCAGASCDPCKLPHASAGCNAGACAIASCAQGSADCDDLAQNGCESDLTTTGSCGACGVKCKPGFFCNSTTGGYLCACPTDPACGNGGGCYLGVCVCGGTGCGIGQSCVAPGQCG